MIPIDLVSRSINRDTFGAMVEYGNTLTNIGFVESPNKPNLFYKKRDCLIIFADMRGSKLTPIWRCPYPIIYWRSEIAIPLWLQRRMVLDELLKFEELNCPFRCDADGFGILPPNYEEIRTLFHTGYIPEGARCEAILGEKNDCGCLSYDCPESCRFAIRCGVGICFVCGKEFNDRGLFCSDACRDHIKHIQEIERKETREQIMKENTDRCPLCDKILIVGYSLVVEEMLNYHNISNFERAVSHHISYIQEITVPVCRSCHAKIHFTKGNPVYDAFKPIDSRFL